MEKKNPGMCVMTADQMFKVVYLRSDMKLSPDQQTKKFKVILAYIANVRSAWAK